ncbi:MAG: hypothetical protein JJU45_06830 [Acidimicrobiia bacterium]|nr:hypothetical protein [Acidimicrobiia bacterium]
MQLSPPADRALRPNRRPPLLTASLLLTALLLVAGCRATAVVDVAFEEDGSGRVEVALGLDSEALARLGDPTVELSLDDLAAAGWDVAEQPEVDADGTTWVNVARSFEDSVELSAVLAEVGGVDGILSGTEWAVTEDEAAVTTRAAVDVDVADGLGALVDEGLESILGPDPLGPLVAEIEAATGEPLAEQVELTVSLSLGEDTVSTTVRPGDPPARVELVAVREKPSIVEQAGTVVGGLVVFGTLAAAFVAALTALRRRSLRH